MAGRSRVVGVALTTVAVVAATVLTRGAGAAPEPPLTITAEQAAAVVGCTGAPATGKSTILLVHGAGQSPASTWDWSYLRTLSVRGWRVCTLRTPDRALGDIQVSAEYVVHAVRRLHRESGRPVDLLGHSLGGVQVRWALRWWQGVRPLVDDVVMLGTPNHGMAVADRFCAPSCAPAIHQLRPRSRFIALVNSGSETYPGPSWTNVYSGGDTLVEASSPPLAGASNLDVDEICPLRENEHGELLADAAVHAAVVDALDHPGPADFLRVDRTSCTQERASGMGEPPPGPPAGGTPASTTGEPAPASYARP